MSHTAFHTTSGSQPGTATGVQRSPTSHGTTMPAAATSSHETSSPSGVRRGSHSAVHTSHANRMSSRVEPTATSGGIESRPTPSTEMGDTASLDTYVSNASGVSGAPATASPVPIMPTATTTPVAPRP
ncbi:hypothetical protein [Kocuria marina]|uniref:Uncharacterized protein n=1 Tax=Kocuria marina subsp. indica TaxID=1049583 RepID=A0A1X7DAU9_9MICC|nr:hypothetical protein [Kocuria indica]OXS82830.1 hypothetical protein B1B07_07625 [Kocuria indica]RLP57699.1 hypothetical protein D9R06_08505 [Kocuria indica]SMF11553.1 hypothetical protein SAMN06296028_11015 [Kocuria indica]